MKTIALTTLWLILGGLAFAQEFERGPEYVRDYVLQHCGARRISEGEDYERVSRIAHQLLKLDQHPAPDVVLINSEVINAWTVNLDEVHAIVCIPLGLVRWQEDADGELAFIIGHELGHAWDEGCKTSAGRSRIARKSHSFGALLFGPSPGDELGDQRNCELRADAAGLRSLVRAHYNPWDAVTSFERMQELQKDRRSGVFGRLAATGSDHPITSDRIRQLKKLIAHQPEFTTR